jgi:hypothetical protein
VHDQHSYQQWHPFNLEDPNIVSSLFNQMLTNNGLFRLGSIENFHGSQEQIHFNSIGSKLGLINDLSKQYLESRKKSYNSSKE